MFFTGQMTQPTVSKHYNQYILSPAFKNVKILQDRKLTYYVFLHLNHG